MEKETVEIQRAWLESLIGYVDKIDHEQVDSRRQILVSSLLGYVSSAKTILKYK